MRVLSYFFVFAFLSICLSSCDDDAGSSDPCNADFDQKAMFTNLADEIIIPAFEELKTKVDILEEKTSAFTFESGAANQAKLSELQTAFTEAYLSWQKVAPLNFGPAESVFLRSSLNNFPLNEQLLESNIAGNIYEFDQPDRFDKGFPALDYLLFQLDDATIISTYNDPSDNNNYPAYLNALVDDIKSRVDQTYDAWTSTYRDEFIDNTGTAAGTSLSLIINNLNENYELIKREKVGVPSGTLTLGFTNPDKVEALYSGISLDLIRQALISSKAIYQGGSGSGLDDYLTEINAMKEDEPLNDVILQRFDDAIAKANGLQGNFSELIETDVEPVVELYNEVTKMVVNLKTDMPSVLCVSITYIDNPSDSD